MKKFHKCSSISLISIGSLFLIYYIYLSLAYGLFNISFSWFFLLIALILLPYGAYEYHYHKHILSLLPKLLSRCFLSIILLCIIIFITVEGYIIYTGLSSSTGHSDTVIVLGAQLNGLHITKSLRYRLDSAIDYAQKYPNAIFIVSGGQGEGEDISEAQAMSDDLVDHGISSENIILEDRSRNTQENFKYSMELMKKSDINTNKSDGITIITNQFHMARAKFIAKQFNVDKIHTFPAKTDMDLAPVFYVREFFGFVKDFMISL